MVEALEFIGAAWDEVICGPTQGPHPARVIILALAHSQAQATWSMCSSEPNLTVLKGLSPDGCRAYYCNDPSKLYATETTYVIARSEPMDEQFKWNYDAVRQRLIEIGAIDLMLEVESSLPGGLTAGTTYYMKPRQQGKTMQLAQGLSYAVVWVTADGKIDAGKS